MIFTADYINKDKKVYVEFDYCRVGKYGSLLFYRYHTPKAICKYEPCGSNSKGMLTTWDPHECVDCRTIVMIKNGIIMVSD